MTIDNSKATVISLCPFPISEFKPGLLPNRFEIPAAKEGDIEILVIGANIVNRFRVPVTGAIINQPVPAAQIANSIVEDRLTGQLSYEADAYPGLFWVPGEYTKETAKASLKDLIEAARLRQRAWFGKLVRMADDDWNKYHQYKFITDLQRHAAEILNLEKEWNKEQVAIATTLKDCIACFSKIDARATICPNCRESQEKTTKVPVKA